MLTSATSLCKCDILLWMLTGSDVVRRDEVRLCKVPHENGVLQGLVVAVGPVRIHSGYTPRTAIDNVRLQHADEH